MTLQTSVRSAKHEAARDMAESGVPMFPCKLDGKLPACPHSFKDATTNIAQIDKWFSEADYNVAFEPERAGLCVLDIDGEQGEKSLAELELENGFLPETYEVRTPRGGRHLYFRGSLPPTASKIGENIDTRGVGSYVLVPPSSVGGRSYEVLKDVEPAELPEWLSSLANQSKQEPRSAPENVELDAPANIARARARLNELVKRGDVAIEGQGGDDRTYRLASEIQELGLSPEKTLDVMGEIWNPHCIPPWSHDELGVKIENASRYMQNAAGAFAVGSPQEAFGSAVAKLEAQTPDQSGNKPEIDNGIVGSDDDLAIQFVNACGKQLRYVAAWNKWFTWNSRRWLELPTPAVWNLIRPLVREYARYVEAGGEKSRNVVRKLVSKPTIANVEALARGAKDILTAVDVWDADPWLLNTPEGIVDLRSGKLHEADPLAYCIKSTAITPFGEDADIHASCPLWFTFLNDVTGGNVELQKFLQRIVGYSLTGTTKEHAMFFLHGIGGNGKGVFISTITGIMPNQVLCRADLDSRVKRNQTGVAMRHNQSDSRKLSRASSGL